MPIPFRLSDEIDTLGEAAFLHVEPQSDRDLRGVLLFLNALGEPKEFVYNRIRLDAAGALWRSGDRYEGAARRLIVSLFDAAQGWPHLLLCRADRVGPGMFGDDRLIALDIPVARLAPVESNQSGAIAADSAERLETFDAHGESLLLLAQWAKPIGPPSATSAAAPLLALLAVRGLLWEPFDRAAAGLEEIFGAA